MIWHSMSTAPRDGTRILLAFGSDAITAGWYEDDDGDAYPWKFLDSGLCHGDFASRNGLNGTRDDEYGPTHWAPMPPTPAESRASSPSEASAGNPATDEHSSSLLSPPQAIGEEKA